METNHDDALTPGVEVFWAAKHAQHIQARGDSASNGSELGPRGPERVGEKAPPDPHRTVYSGAGVVLYGFQMRGLETISAPRRNGRGPDSSLKTQRIFVWIHVYSVTSLRTVIGYRPQPSILIRQTPTLQPLIYLTRTVT